MISFEKIVVLCEWLKILTGNKTPAATLIEPNETKTTGEANTSNSTTLAKNSKTFNLSVTGLGTTNAAYYSWDNV